ncbi:MAG: redoxin family protein [Cytophaga sp.]|uniref:redoxin family protein n=1 Tax=Cytophaga sp. TaxID=29535 RepID=UPI003F808C30
MKSFISTCILFVISCCLHAETKQINLAVGDKAPEISVLDPSNKTITLSALRGKIVLVNFWSSGCSPCRLKHPQLIKIYNSYKAYGFDIMSVSLDTKKDQWLTALRYDRMPWPNQGVDLQGWNSKLVNAYGLAGTLSSFLIDEEGTILKINQTEIELEQTLHYLIFDQPRFYPAVANEKIYFNVISKYSIIDANGYVVLKGRATEVAIGSLATGEYTLKYEDKTERFLKVKPESPAVTFYPTRTEDFITLSREADYYIYNQRGKLEFKGNGTTIDVRKLPLGVYYLSVEGNIHSFFKK